MSSIPVHIQIQTILREIDPTCIVGRKYQNIGYPVLFTRKDDTPSEHMMFYAPYGWVTSFVGCDGVKLARRIVAYAKLRHELKQRGLPYLHLMNPYYQDDQDHLLED